MFRYDLPFLILFFLFVAANTPGLLSPVEHSEAAKHKQVPFSLRSQPTHHNEAQDNDGFWSHWLG